MAPPLKHFIDTQDFSLAELKRILELTRLLKDADLLERRRPETTGNHALVSGGFQRAPVLPACRMISVVSRTGGGRNPMSELMLDQTQAVKALPSLMEVEDVAALLHVSRSLLAKWRMVGRGPRHMKIGRRILYECAEVTGWLKTQRRASTLE